MSPCVPSRLPLVLACASLVTACAAPRVDDPDPGPAPVPAASAQGPDAVGQAPEPAPPAPVLPSGREEVPALLRPASMVWFPAYGPTPGVVRSDFDAWTALLAERFYEQPDNERVDAIRQALAEVHVVDLTPCYLNLMIGLDMAVPADVEIGRAVTDTWYKHQVKYTSVVLPAEDPTDVRPEVVESRHMVVDAWRRWWERTVSDPARVARYRKRIDQTVWELTRVGRPPEVP